uniref:Cytochrome b-c1 complex subunit 8 n=1 Tax=Propithecus coquereli TaxID=379532 RepID=A0A2K6GJA8_PROCO
MGSEFRNLMQMRHMITCSLSPFQQCAFPHYFTKGIPNVLRRTRAPALRVVFYLVDTWGTEGFEKSKRKNSAAYENDK